VPFRPEEFDKLAGPSLVILIFCVESLRSEESRLHYIPLVVNVAFDDPEPAEVNGGIRAWRNRSFRRSETSFGCPPRCKVGCSGGVDKVFSELSDELVTPSCTGLAGEQVSGGLGSIAFWACIGCSSASFFPNANW
jgi:hypothetical protein